MSPLEEWNTSLWRAEETRHVLAACERSSLFVFSQATTMRSSTLQMDTEGSTASALNGECVEIGG